MVMVSLEVGAGDTVRKMATACLGAAELAMCLTIAIE